MVEDIYLIMLLVAIAAIWWFFYGPYQKYRVDKARYHLFVIRDELFDQARAGVMSFDDQAYRIARTNINGALRFIEYYTWFYLLMMLIKYRREEEFREIVTGYRTNYADALRKVDADARQVVEKSLKNMVLVVLAYCVHTSLLLFVIAHSLGWAIRLRAKFRRQYRQLLSIISTDANISGHNEAPSYITKTNKVLT